MRIEFQRTFSHFVDNYIAAYFGTPGKTIGRLIGGPFLIVLGAFFILFTNLSVIWLLFKVLVYIISGALILYGFYYTLLPVFNILLVWLRREQFIGAKDASIALELVKVGIRVFEGGDSFDIPFKKVLAVKRRAKAAWIITKTDHLVYLPLDGLLSGDAEVFLDELEAAIAPEEEEE